MQRAVVVTDVVDVEDAHCSHNCTQIVRLTNVLNDTSWEMCIISFENLVGRALQQVECHAKGCKGKCKGCSCC